MGFGAWLRERRATWQPVPGTPGGMKWLLFLLATFVVLGVDMVRLDLSGELRHPRTAEDVLMSSALCLLCLGLITRRTRFQLTSRVLTGAVLLALAAMFFLRWK